MAGNPFALSDYAFDKMTAAGNTVAPRLQLPQAKPFFRRVHW